MRLLRSVLSFICIRMVVWSRFRCFCLLHFFNLVFKVLKCSWRFQLCSSAKEGIESLVKSMIMDINSNTPRRCKRPKSAMVQRPAPRAIPMQRLTGVMLPRRLRLRANKTTQPSSSLRRAGQATSTQSPIPAVTSLRKGENFSLTSDLTSLCKALKYCSSVFTRVLSKLALNSTSSFFAKKA